MSGVDDNEHDLGATGNLAVDEHGTVAFARSRGQLVYLGLDFDRVPRPNLPPEPRLVEPPKQRQFSDVLVGVAEHGVGPHLGDGLTHQNAGKRRPTGKVTRKPEFVPGQGPGCLAVLEWAELDNLVQKQKGWTVREDLAGRWERRHSPQTLGPKREWGGAEAPPHSSDCRCEPKNQAPLPAAFSFEPA